MQNFHTKLTQKYQIYNNWHQTKHHNKVHWGVLVLYTLFIFSLIINPFGFDSDNKLNTSSTKAQTNLEIPLTVEEPAGVERISEPITSGIPLPPGTQTTNWSLFDGIQEIPLQVTSLQGRTPWILLDFQTSVPANGKKTLTLKDTAGTAVSSKPINITEDASQITVDNKIIKTKLSKTNFNLFEEVWIDKDNDGTYSQTEQIIAPDQDNIQIVDSTTGTTFSGKGVPTKIVWEYKGPLRSTLRVDGKYMNGTTGFIAYTIRMTFYAGRSDVKIEHILRNSYQTNERHVKIKSAIVKIGTEANQLRATKSNSFYWANVGSNGVAFEMVPSIMGVSAVSDIIDVDQNGGWLLPDLTHEGRTLIADFSEGLSFTEQTRRANATRSPLFAMAPPSWYSEYGELSTSKFSTLDNEKQAYQKWGWTWRVDQEPRDPHKPDYLIYWWPDIHGDTEADDLWQNLMMYLRTGSHGYWDRAIGWAWFFKHRYTFRSDGFEFAWNGSYENPKIDRPLISITLTATDQAYLDNDVRGGKVDSQGWGADHMWGWGLIDYYYLTGDVDALEAAIDLAEISKRILGWWTPGPYKGLGNGYNVGDTGVRQEARQLLLVTRVYEATLDLKWQDYMEHIVQLFLQSQDWDPRGFYLWPRGDKQKTVAPIHFANLGQAWDAYYRVTGSGQVRDRLIQMANFAKIYALHATWNYTGYYVAFDYPNPGDIFHGNFDDGGLSGFAPGMTVAWIDALVRGYRLTGDNTFLERAKFHWNRGSKARYGDPTARTAGDNEVGLFMNNHFLGGSGGYLYDENGYLPLTHLLFYDVIPPDTTPPTVSITASTPGSTVSGTVTVSVNASDDIGVVGVQFKLDGQNLDTEDISSPYSIIWNTTTATNGSHTLTAIARDAAGNQTTSAPITVTVSNTALVNLADNTWAYMDPIPSLRYIPVPEQPDAEQQLVESREPLERGYTGIVYGNSQIFYFGGGHHSYPGNDVEIYDIATNIWKQSYKPNVPPAGDPVYGSGGSPYSWVDPTTGEVRPYTIHGYARTTYHPVLKRYVTTASFCKTTQYNIGTGKWECADPDFGNPDRVELISFDPDSNRWYRLSSVPSPGDLSQWDSGLGGILSISGGNIWLFKDNVWTQHDQVNVTLAGNGGSASVYIPELQSHLFAVMPQGNCCADYIQGRLYLYNSITKTLKEITSTPLLLKEQFAPEGNFVMAYDTMNKRVVVLTSENKNLDTKSRVQPWIYDPFTDTWQPLPISISSPLIPGFSAFSRSPFQYDPINNAFILLRVTDGTIETWAYRYKKASSVPDIKAPTNPTNLSATAISSSQINLSWTASTDDVGVTGYKIYRCSGSACAPTVQIATSPTNSYSNTGLTASIAYTYAVSAYDAAGNESAKSSSVSATTLFQFKPSDLNQDTKVNQLDLDILKQDYNRTDKPPSDLNQDGIVDSRDLGIMMGEWNR